MGCGASSTSAGVGLGAGQPTVSRATNPRASSAKHKAKQKVPHPDELHDAIAAGDPDKVKELLDAGAHVEAKLPPRRKGGKASLFRKRPEVDETKLKVIWAALDEDGSGKLA